MLFQVFLRALEPFPDLTDSFWRPLRVAHGLSTGEKRRTLALDGFLPSCCVLVGGPLLLRYVCFSCRTLPDDF